MSGGIRRGPSSTNVDVLRRETVRDVTLSYRARGVLHRLLSNAEGFSMTAADLAEEGKEGRGAILSALKELRDAGYLQTIRSQDSKGHWRTDNVIFDVPQKRQSDDAADPPKSENRTPVARTPVNRMSDSSTLKAGIAGGIAVAAATLTPQPNQAGLVRCETLSDFAALKALVDEFGDEAVQRAAKTILTKGKSTRQPWPSNVRKLLGLERQESAKRTQQAKSDANEAAALAAKAQRDELLAKFFALPAAERERQERDFAAWVQTDDATVAASYGRKGIDSVFVRQALVRWLTQTSLILAEKNRPTGPV